MKLDMKAIQNMNLFEKITGVKSRCCFTYNNTIIFVVPKHFMSKALGNNAANISNIGNRLNKKIRVIADPQGKHDLEGFVQAIIYPHDFKNILLENDELVIFSLPRTKAALIGRNKSRIEELSNILEQFFGIKHILIK